MKPPQRCYLCGVQLVSVPRGYNPPLRDDHKTSDHVPPYGIFCDPKPSNLISVPCCNKHNGKHSGVDERLRMVAALEIERNAGGETILLEKVFGSTMAKLRQPHFIMELAKSMRDEFVMTPNGPVPVSVFSVPGKELLDCAEDIVRGLLAKFHPGFDYYRDKVVAVDIHTATIAKADWDGERQLLLVREVTGKTKREARGTHDEFVFWHEVDYHRHMGVWFLVFYGALGFFVLHHKSDYVPPL